MNKILSKSVVFIFISSIQFYSASFLSLHACSCWHHHNSDDDDDDDDDDGDVAGGRRKVIIG